ncbi:DUF202 domain-containing protein [Calditrichota bacterium]
MEEEQKPQAPVDPESVGGLGHLAVERNMLAGRRTLLANERTYSAWVRTGLAATAAGLGIGHLLCAPGGQPLTCLIGGIFIIAGIFMYIVAFRQYWQGHLETPKDRVKTTPTWVFAIITVMLVLSSLMALALFWVGTNTT